MAGAEWGGKDPLLVHPVLRRRAQKVLDWFGGDLRVESAHRTSQRQQELYDCWQRREPGCNPANPPGTSNHEATPWGEPRALAIDFRIRAGATLSWPAVHVKAAEHRIHFPITREPWHGQMDESPLAVFTGDPFPNDAPKRDEDAMGIYVGTFAGGVETVPLPPAGGGASGAEGGLPGYNDDVYVSVSLTRATPLAWKVIGEGGAVLEEKTQSLPEGRTLIVVTHPPAAGKPWPNAVTLVPRDDSRKAWFVEWARPPLPDE